MGCSAQVLGNPRRRKSGRTAAGFCCGHWAMTHELLQKFEINIESLSTSQQQTSVKRSSTAVSSNVALCKVSESSCYMIISRFKVDHDIGLLLTTTPFLVAESRSLLAKIVFFFFWCLV